MNTGYLQRCACVVALCFAVVLALSGCTRDTKVQSHLQQQRPAKLAFPESEIPGEYRQGGDLGTHTSLELKPNHRFVFKLIRCMGNIDANQGTWSLDGDVLTCHPEKPNTFEEASGMNIRYIPVKWGSHYFLVDENKMAGFCVMSRKMDSYHLEQLEAGDCYYLNEDYIKVQKVKGLPIEGKPLVPERYRDFYERGVITATIIRVVDARHAFIDKGSDDRVKSGMMFSMFDGALDLEVVSTGKHESKVRPIYYYYSNTPVKVGDKFTTGSAYGRPCGTGYQRFSEPPKAPKAKHTSTVSG